MALLCQQQNQINKQQTQISELIPKVGNNNTINNNQKFNIHVFLNEQCKDALNLSDFVKSLHVTLEQLDFTNKNGLADGISKTIIDNMSKLSIYERPLHCTDIKRETLYIKENLQILLDIENILINIMCQIIWRYAYQDI